MFRAGSGLQNADRPCSLCRLDISPQAPWLRVSSATGGLKRPSSQPLQKEAPSNSASERSVQQIGKQSAHACGDNQAHQLTLKVIMQATFMLINRIKAAGGKTQMSTTSGSSGAM